jgi:hypothetical protein
MKLHPCTEGRVQVPAPFGESMKLRLSKWEEECHDDHQ